MDLGIVHPIPLAVHDVVAEFHVLDDLRRREQRSCPTSQKNRFRLPNNTIRPPTSRIALGQDGAPQVRRVTHAAIGFDLTTQGVEFGAERLDIGLGQMCVFVDVSDCHAPV